MSNKEKAAIIIEIAGVVMIGIGVGVEVGYEANVGFFLITAGSLMVAVGALFWTKVLGN